MDNERIERIQQELKNVGAGRIALRTPEAHELANILHQDERIGGVVYGRYTNGLAWLIATDKRVIFMDKKPLHKTMDELSYDVISGVRNMKAGPTTSITLHTRLGDYNIKYVSIKCAEIFTKYIETRKVEASENKHPVLIRPIPISPEVIPSSFDDESLKFVKNHNIGVLSTIDRLGNVFGSVVNYVLGQDDLFYILLKTETSKSRNVLGHNQVALTITDEGSAITVEVGGSAEVEVDQIVAQNIYSQIINTNSVKKRSWMSPILKVHEGVFMVIKITPTMIKYVD